jgi:hypothetical protein
MRGDTAGGCVWYLCLLLVRGGEIYKHSLEYPGYSPCSSHAGARCRGSSKLHSLEFFVSTCLSAAVSPTQVWGLFTIYARWA